MVHLAIIIMLMVRILGMTKMMVMLVVRMPDLVLILVGDSVLKLLVAALSSILDLEIVLITLSIKVF